MMSCRRPTCDPGFPREIRPSRARDSRGHADRYVGRCWLTRSIGARSARSSRLRKWTSKLRPAACRPARECAGCRPDPTRLVYDYDARRDPRASPATLRPDRAAVRWTASRGGLRATPTIYENPGIHLDTTKISKPTRPPTTVPLMRTYCRSLPTCSSSLLTSVSLSQP
jgi:hypothetical protein